MEASGEFTAPSPEERIRQAALERVLDTERGVWAGERESPITNRLTFILEIDDPQEEEALHMVSINAKNSISIVVAQFREDLSATEADNVYQLTGFRHIMFPDLFDSTVTEGDSLAVSELNRLADVLEDENLKEVELYNLADDKGVMKALAITKATLKTNYILGDRLESQIDAIKNSDNSAPGLKARRIASTLKRILRF